MHALERAMQVAVIEASRIVEQGGAIVWLQLALALVLLKLAIDLA